MNIAAIYLTDMEMILPMMEMVVLEEAVVDRSSLITGPRSAPSRSDSKRLTTSSFNNSQKRRTSRNGELQSVRRSCRPVGVDTMRFSGSWRSRTRLRHSTPCRTPEATRRWMRSSRQRSAKIAKGRIGRKLTLKTRELVKRRLMITGRQSLWIVYREFALDEERGTLYDLSDLLAVRNPDGDKTLEIFFDEWETTIQAMSEDPPPSLLEILFLEQIKKSEALATEVAEYRRASRGHPHRTYNFLYDSVARYLHRQRFREESRCSVEVPPGQADARAQCAPSHRGGSGR